MLNFGDARVVDPVLTNLAMGYKSPKPELANFIFPSVGVNTRAGQVIRFGKEQFAVGDYRRAPGTNIPHVSSRYDSVAYACEQETLAYEIPVEVVEEAANGPAAIDLRTLEVNNLVARMQQSYEKACADIVADASIYESGLAYDTHTDFVTDRGTGTVPWSDPAASIIGDTIKFKRYVSDHIAIRPNSAVIGTNVYDTLLTSPDVLERIKYTTADSISEDMLANYFGLERGMLVADNRYLAADGTLQPIFPENGVLFFYSAGDVNTGILPAGGMSMNTPSAFYTYLLNGYPQMTPEYLVKERRVVRGEMTIERSPNVVGLGATGLCGGAFFIADIFS